MKYRVIGQNKDSGARMALEFEAESKAAAECKAISQNMSVNRVEDITDGHVGHASDPNPRAGRRRPGGNKLVPILIVVIVAAIAWMYRARLLALIHH